MNGHNPSPYINPDEDWKHARRQALYQRVVCAITQCSVDLLSFEEVRRRLHLSERVHRGLQVIPLDSIRGSVGRYNDFTSTFLPRKSHLRERWERVDRAMWKGKIPPIDVYKIGQVYFVLDGNHRVSVAREQGLEKIEAFVTEFATPLGSDTPAEIDDQLIQSERAAFQEKLEQAGGKAASEFSFSCAGSYRLLAGQIENYREGLESKTGRPASIEEAYSAWREEVYRPAIEAIREEGLLRLFPGRTEADLFIWAWENGGVLRELVSDEAD